MPDQATAAATPCQVDSDQSNDVSNHNGQEKRFALGTLHAGEIQEIVTHWIAKALDYGADSAVALKHHCEMVACHGPGAGLGATHVECVQNCLIETTLSYDKTDELFGPAALKEIFPHIDWQIACEEALKRGPTEMAEYRARRAEREAEAKVQTDEVASGSIAELNPTAPRMPQMTKQQYDTLKDDQVMSKAADTIIRSIVDEGFEPLKRILGGVCAAIDLAMEIEVYECNRNFTTFNNEPVTPQPVGPLGNAHMKVFGQNLDFPESKPDTEHPQCPLESNNVLESVAALVHTANWHLDRMDRTAQTLIGARMGQHQIAVEEKEHQQPLTIAAGA